MWPGPRPTSTWHLDPSSLLATINVGQSGELLCPFLGRGSWVPIQHNVVWAKANLPNKWHLDPSSRLATTDMGRKLGAVPLWGRGSWVTI